MAMWIRFGLGRVLVSLCVLLGAEMPNSGCNIADSPQESKENRLPTSRNTSTNPTTSITTSSNTSNDEISAIRRALERVPDWNSRLNDDQWKQIIDCAVLLQQADPKVLERELFQIWYDALEKEPNATRATMLEMKPFLVLRVMFDLPTDAPASELKNFTGFHCWEDYPLLARRETANISWPISWQSDKPQIIEEFPPAKGGRGYRGDLEYKHFLKYYKMRNLDRLTK